jgi:DNA-directed RNA polymerase subunit beta'
MAKSKKDTLHPRLTLTGGKAEEAGVYRLAPGAIVAVEDGQTVEAGEVLARMPREACAYPRHHRRSAARRGALRGSDPKDKAIIARVSGRVQFLKDYKAKRKIAIVPDDGSAAHEELVPKSRVIEVQEGDYVKRGDNLVGGSPDPHDILERSASRRSPNIS